MSKITSKYQITIPRAIAERQGLRPGDEIAWREDGDAIVLYQPGKQRKLAAAERLDLFDRATARQREREKKLPRPSKAAAARGWTRADLYEPHRGLPHDGRDR